MANENNINELMDIDPLELTSTPGTIDAIIAYHRKNRANAAAGIKAKKETGPKKDLSEALKGMFGEAAPAPVASGIRRR